MYAVLLRSGQVSVKTLLGFCCRRTWTGRPGLRIFFYFLAALTQVSLTLRNHIPWFLRGCLRPGPGT